jgi:hypothetical protein
MTIDFEIVRNWVSFIFFVAGGTIAIRTYVLNQRQRKLENSFRLIELCKNSLSNEDLMSWHLIHVASSEQAGAKHGFFVEKEEQIPFSELFTPNIIAQGAIERFCELFNLVCYEYLKGTVDIRLFYFEYGQYMNITYYWVSNVNNNTEFVKSNYPYFYKTFRKKEDQFLKLPHKTISHLE